MRCGIADFGRRALQGVSKKTLFCGFDTPGGNAMISWNVDQSQSVPQGDKRTAKERALFH